MATVTDVEFGYLEGVSSNIQVQFDSISPSGSDLTNSLDYATGNGSTDDTAALITWLAGGENLYLGKGTYKISSQVASTATRSNIKITAHPNAKIVPTATYNQSGGAFLKLQNITNLTIDGLYIEGNGAIASPALNSFDNNMNGIHVEDCTNVTIKYCHFTEQPKSAIRVDDCTRVNLLYNTALNCWNGATECYNCTDVFQLGGSLTGKGTAQGANGTTLGNLTGMFFNDCNRVRAIGVSLFDWKTTPTKADGCFDTVFLALQVSTFGKDGIKIQNSTANQTLKRGIISKCEVKWMRTWVTDGSSYVQISNCEEGIIQGNICEGDGGTIGNENGVYVFSSASGFTSKNIIVSNNTVRNMRRSGILTDKIANTIISNNIVTDYSTGVTTDFGIYCFTSATNVKILNNSISNTTMPATNSSHAIQVQAASNVDIRGNTIKNSRQEGIRIVPAAGDYLNICDNIIESTNDVAVYIVSLNQSAAVAVTNIKMNGNTFAKNCLTTSSKAVVLYTGNNANSAFTISQMQFANNTISKGGASATNAPLQMYNDGFGSVAKFDHSANVYGTGIAQNPTYTMTPTLITEGSNQFRGIGTPEGVITADIGAIYIRTNGGATTTLYIKTSGTGNTGWTAK